VRHGSLHLVSLALAGVLGPGLMPAAAQGPLGALRPALEHRIAGFRGTVGIAVIDLKSGDTLGIRATERFPTASLIKVPVLVELFHQIEHGKLHLDDPLTMLAADQEPGSGVLRFFQAPHTLTVRDAATLMIIVSDNTASNLLIDKLGVRHVNARMDSLGLTRTRLYRKLFMPEESIEPDSSARYGVGVTTPMEMAKLFAMLYRGEAVSAEASAHMVAMLKEQFSVDRIPRELPPQAVVAHKTGEVDDVRNDCGIIYAPVRDFVFCAFTKDDVDQSWRVDNDAYRLIADLARTVYDGLNGTGSR
jgi:beta-lactamase class A